jgi:hypothetical protein
MTSTQEHVKNVRDRLARYKEKRMGLKKKRILLLLLAGITIGLSGSPRTTWKMIGAVQKEWRELGRQAAERSLNSLYTSKLVDAKENPDGTLTLVLTEKGRKRALTYNIGKLKISQPTAWDKLWRVISFDIPEDEKPSRDAIRGHLLAAGFYELHNSVLVYPFECRKELEFITELYDARKYVRFILATNIDNEAELKNFFNVS